MSRTRARLVSGAQACALVIAIAMLLVFGIDAAAARLHPLSAPAVRRAGAPPLNRAASTLPTVEAQAGQVLITQDGIAPSILTTTIGIPVTWINATETLQIVRSGFPPRIYLPLVSRTGGAEQTAVYENGPAREEGGESFGADLWPGLSFTHTFAVTGTHPFYLETAPNFKGVIIVLPADSSLPPDPVDVAPPLDESGSTSLLDATAFLYTGPNPIQTDVVSGTIAAQRVAVLRGKVSTRAGAALSGVRITALGHPEYGQTLTRDDGMFDLAVNGGGLLTLRYEKDGFLPVQRAVTAPWRDYAWMPEVIMIPFDPAVTAVDLGAATLQVARGSVMSDADGARQATILFPQGTTATLVLPDGTTSPLTMLHVRATEFTVGDAGPAAMPAELPPSSGYTYAAEFSVDEAVAAGATDVRFSQPLPMYVENFLGFPVGEAVPTGYYDRQRGQWVASANGRVIQVLSITAGMADLDLEGNGVAAGAAALAALGITNDERTRLAQLYMPGQSLWRVPISHFTPWDCNWPFGPPDDAEPPPADDDDGIEPDDQNVECASVIGCEGQTLGEALPIAGTSWWLHYQSDRTPGRKDVYTLKVLLTKATVPASLRAIRVEVTIAGRHFQETFAPAPDLTYNLAWDGKDAYGRLLRGQQTAVVTVHYDYTPQYYAVRRDFENSFARAEALGLALTSSRNASRITLSSTRTVPVIFRDARAAGLAGWSLSIHHVYDPAGQTLYLGDGRKRRAGTLAVAATITALAGNGAADFSGDGGPALAAGMDPEGIAIGPDGSLYIADWNNHRIRRLGPDGLVTTVVGNGTYGFSGDGGPALAASLYHPTRVAFGSDGSLYISDSGNFRIRRVGPDGIITTVAGNGNYGFSGDGGPAVAASLDAPLGLAIGADGSLYFADFRNNRIRRVGTDGLITTVAGNGSVCCVADGAPATAAGLWNPYDVAIGPDGSLYIANSMGRRVHRVGVDGIITTVAGNGGSCCLGDGGPAIVAMLDRPQSVAVGRDGRLYIADSLMQRVRRVGLDGIITTVAGNGGWPANGDGGPAAAASVHLPRSLAIDPDGSLYLAEGESNRVRRVRSAFPNVDVADVLLPAADGSELYVFDSSGRHLRTLDALTGALRLLFTYDPDGYLIAITDGSGNVTTIERAGTTPTAIVAPGGQRTRLGVHGGGWLESLTNPADEAHTMSYTADGLLTQFVDPLANVHRFTYDALGRLTRDEDPAGGTITLSRIEQSGGFTVTTVSAPGRSRAYRVESLPTGAIRRTVIEPDGAKTTTLLSIDGGEQITYTDGTLVTVQYAPDPRWGMLAPFVRSQTIKTPDGRVQSTTRARLATLDDAKELLSLRTFSESVTIDGRTTTIIYDAQTHRITTTSPSGRTTVSTLDEQGRTVQTQLTGLEPITFAYDSRGQLAVMTMGSGASARTTTLAYGATGPAAAHLVSVTDPLSRQTSFTYDAAGRTTQELLYGGQIISYTYDAAGQLTGLTPPGRAAHRFTYRADGQLTAYTPPSPMNGVPGAATNYLYDSLGRLTGIEQADGQAVTIAYDAIGRPFRVSQPQGVITATHNAASGVVNTIHTSAGVVLTFGYDGLLPKSETWSGPVAGSVSRTFDAALRTATRSVNGAAITLEYDPDSLLVRAGALTLGRHPAHGMVVSTTLGVVTDTWSYTGFGGLESYTARAGGVDLYAVQYTRDKLGRIVEASETISGVTTIFAYTYDAAGRLTAVVRNAAPFQSYTYDGNGNRVSAGPPASPVAASYDGQDRLIGAGGATYSHTLNGEIQSRTVSEQITNYTYDALGNLVKVTLPSSEQITYIFDGLDRRVGKRVNGVLVQGWLYDEQARVVAELDGSGAVTSRFVYGSRPNTPDYMARGAATYRIVSDHLGSPRLVVNAADGAVVQRIDYDPYGNISNETLAPGFPPIPFGFAGGIYDRHTQLTRFGVRDYDAATGRWMTRDPRFFATDGTNLYAYASNDPINRRDVDGMDDEPAGGGICILKPQPLPGYDQGPIYLDPKPQKPEPPVKPVPSFADIAKEQQKKASSPGGGGKGPGDLLTVGPIKFTPSPNTPSISDVRDKDPKDWFNSFDLTIDAPIYPDFSLPPKREKPGGPDPNAPHTKPRGPQCKPKLNQPDPSGCEQ